MLPDLQVIVDRPCDRFGKHAKGRFPELLRFWPERQASTLVALGGQLECGLRIAAAGDDVPAMATVIYGVRASDGAHLELPPHCAELASLVTRCD